MSRQAEAVAGIECISEGTRVVVASDAVDRIVELEIARLPLAHPFVTGIAVHENEIVVAVRAGLHGGSETGPARHTSKAVLLVKGQHTARFAVEIDQVLSFIQAQPKPHEAGRATCADGRELPWLDVAWLARTLGEGASS